MPGLGLIRHHDSTTAFVPSTSSLLFSPSRMPERLSTLNLQSSTTTRRPITPKPLCEGAYIHTHEDVEQRERRRQTAVHRVQGNQADPPSLCELQVVDPRARRAEASFKTRPSWTDVRWQAEEGTLFGRASSLLFLPAAITTLLV